MLHGGYKFTLLYLIVGEGRISGDGGGGKLGEILKVWVYAWGGGGK